jgi:PKD repeat protein
MFLEDDVMSEIATRRSVAAFPLLMVRELLVLSFVALLAACGGGDSSTPNTPSQPVSPPVGSFTVSPTGAAVVSATVMAFNATASDPSGSALTYTWDFGDGQRGLTGQNVTHVFDTAGTFTVVLTIRNAGGASVTANGAVTARTLTGTWADLDPQIHFELTQSGSSLSGRRLGGAGYVRVGAVSGTITNPKKVDLDLFLEDSDCKYSGTASGDANNITVSRTNSGAFCAQNSYNITRQ